MLVSIVHAILPAIEQRLDGSDLTQSRKLHDVILHRKFPARRLKGLHLEVAITAGIRSFMGRRLALAGWSGGSRHVEVVVIPCGEVLEEVINGRWDRAYGEERKLKGDKELVDISQKDLRMIMAVSFLLFRHHRIGEGGYAALHGG